MQHELYEFYSKNGLSQERLKEFTKEFPDPEIAERVDSYLFFAAPEEIILTLDLSPPTSPEPPSNLDTNTKEEGSAEPNPETLQLKEHNRKLEAEIQKLRQEL